MSLDSNWHDSSAFKLYSFGIAAENKVLSSNELWVVPIEVFPAMEGELGEEISELKHKGVNSFDEPYEVTVKHGQAIPCKWLQWGSNRKTAPDVRRGERILIYRVADGDEEFYWVCPGLDDHLRRLETVLWLFNANPDGLSDQKSDIDSSYAIEFSTHKKLLTLKTTMLNGEPFTHVLQLNTGTGAFTYSDNIKNFVEVDSRSKKITLHNAAGTYWQLNDKDLIGHAERDLTVDAVRNMSFTCENYTVKANAKFTVNAKSAKISAPDGIELDGPVTCKKTLKVEGKTTASGIVSDKPIQGPTNTI